MVVMKLLKSEGRKKERNKNYSVYDNKTRNKETYIPKKRGQR